MEERYKQRSFYTVHYFYDTTQEFYSPSDVPDANFNDYIPLDPEQVAYILNLYNYEIQELKQALRKINVEKLEDLEHEFKFLEEEVEYV